MKNIWNNILTKEFLIEEYEVKKLSMAKISKSVFCHHNIIALYLKKYNIEIRPKSYYSIGKRNGRFGLPVSDETRRKVSIANTGKLSGKNHPNYRHGKTLSSNYCPECGVLLKSYKSKKCYKCNRLGTKASKETKLKYSLMRRGKNNPNWKDGKSFEPYPINWTSEFKESIRERDNHTCKFCNKKQGKRKLDVHHIDYNKENLNPDNLISLCKACHSKTNYNRNYWEVIFSK